MYIVILQRSMPSRTAFELLHNPGMTSEETKKETRRKECIHAIVNANRQCPTYTAMQVKPASQPASTQKERDFQSQREPDLAVRL